MSQLSITLPAPAVATPNGSSGASGLANLVSPDPREVALADVAGAASFAIDLGVQSLVDTFFLGFTNATAAGAFTFKQDGQVAIGQGVVAHSYRRAARTHCFLQLAAPITTRFIYVTAPCVGRLQAGVLAAGLAVRSRGREVGWGRPLADTSAVQRLISGSFGLQRGVAAGGWSGALILSTEERERLYALALDAGIGATVLLAEHTDGGLAYNEALHWGLLAKLEAFAADTADESKWSVQVQDWA